MVAEEGNGVLMERAFFNLSVELVMSEDSQDLADLGNVLFLVCRVDHHVVKHTRQEDV